MMKKLSLFLVSIIALAILAAQSASAGLNDFFIASYNIEYQLGQDSEDRSTLTTKETIVAEFSQLDVNHGIERLIPKEYGGHPTSLKIVAVTDRNGKDWPYSTRSNTDSDILRIGDADEYVHGRQTFKIEYTQRDVTKNFTTSNRDEFYWDTNGTGWKVPINKLSVQLNIDDQLAAKLDGNKSCYQGMYGASQTCTLAKNNNTYTVEASGLNAGENVTIALGFLPDTFAEYEMSTFEKLLNGWAILQSALIIPAVGLIIWLSVRYYRQSNRSSEHDPIAPEYIPPADSSVAVASTLLTTNKGFSAELIDLAVRHYLKIYQTNDGKSFFSSAEYEIEIIKPIDSLRVEEREILKDIFKNKTSVGSRLEMKKLKNDHTLYERMKNNPKQLKNLIRNEYGLRHKIPAQSAWFSRFSKRTLIAGVVLLSPITLLVALVAFGMAKALWPLTDKGLALVRYLKGLKMYINVAEKERLKMLQSPEGAAKVAVDTNDSKQLVKLYERVLPYAVLFGQEKDWNKQLGRYYETTQSQPNWYVASAGASAFNASIFSSAMSSFSATAASSSASGGSSGGGSSGGGGGGGGGGGW